MFEKCVKGTIDLIARQVVQVQLTYAEKLLNIFLSGGFAENEYLFKEVESAAAEGGIEVHRADDCWSGVVKGAVLRGMGVGMDALHKARTCPRHYGICTSQVYAGWRDCNARTFRDGFDGRQMVPEQLIWLVQRRNIILPNKPIESTFDIQCKFARLGSGESVQMIVAATAMEKPPSNLSDLPRGPEYPITSHSLQWILKCRLLLMVKGGRSINGCYDSPRFFDYMLTLVSTMPTRRKRGRLFKHKIIRHSREVNPNADSPGWSRPFL
ncbi:MAG: hypothetical protein M1813_004699 [Trichoglossum hirsutum]|nr:MAG: hypothetical protein M1813_004699 [Trichoglossum hirsutum]